MTAPAAEAAAGAEALAALRAGGKPALARALARLEACPEDAATTALLDAALADPQGESTGLTGPPGVGKSTLIDAMIRHWRAAGRTVGVLAVDPSSRLTGGALLGDRTRFATDPADRGVFVRSMAARDRLGGLAATTFPAMVLMRALYDEVIVETVGVGQSETEIAGLCDRVVLCAQPGAGDALQAMKAGIMEIPDLVVVTKADLGAPAERAMADLRSALSLGSAPGRRTPEVVACSASRDEGVGALLAALAGLTDETAAAPRHRAQAARWHQIQLAAEIGRAGLAALERAGRMPAGGLASFREAAALAERVRAALTAAIM
jgi:LAO/AO transport system kinase